jgi:hypothetical protein
LAPTAMHLYLCFQRPCRTGRTQQVDLGDSHNLSCQEAQPTAPPAPSLAASTSPCALACATSGREPADAGSIESRVRPGRPRGKSKTPQIPGFHGFDEEARLAGLTPASLRRLVRQRRYPAPANISRHQMYPDGNCEKIASERFEQCNAPEPDLPPRRGRPRTR